MTVRTVPSLSPNAGLSQLAHVALAGPEVGAILLGTMIFINESSFRTGDTQNFSFDWQMGLRMAICAMCGLYGLAHLRETKSQFLKFPMFWVLLFGVWNFLTLPWAIQKYYALGSATLLWSIILFTPAVLQQLGGRMFAIVAVAGLTLFQLGSWFAYLFVPALGRSHLSYDDLSNRMNGLSHANGTGILSALGIGLLVMLICQRDPLRKLCMLLLPMYLATLVLTDSRTAMLCAAAAIGVCLYRTRPVLAVALGCLFAVLLTAASLASQNNPMAAVSRTGDADEIYTLTGRLTIWTNAVEKISRSPIFGYGYNCSRFALLEFNDPDEEDAAFYHAHNMYLNIALGTGVLGGLLIGCMVLSQGISLLTRPDVYPDVVFVVIAISSLTEVSLFHATPDACSVLWLSAMCWRQMNCSLQDSALEDHAHEEHVGRLALGTAEDDDCRTDRIRPGNCR